MRYRKLGRTGLTVSEIGHGLWGMGEWSGSEDQQSREALKLSAELGCNFFDSARAYGEGKSDSLLGELLAANHAKNLVAASKVPPLNRKWPASSADPYHEVFPHAHVFKVAGQIRERLQADSIDLLQLHVWHDGWLNDPAAEREFRATVEDLKRRRIIRFFGISLNRWEPANGIRAIRTGLVDAVQVIYNIFDQAPEDELFPVCRELEIGVIARVPLDEGGLTGKLTLETKFPPNDWRSGYFNETNLRPTVERAERLKTLLPSGMSLPELALRFIMSNPVVSTTIVGMRESAHVRQNLAVSDAGPLAPDLLKQLKEHRWERRPTKWSA